MAFKKTATARESKQPLSQLAKGKKCLYCEATGKLYVGMEPAETETGFKWTTIPCHYCSGKGERE